MEKNIFKCSIGRIPPKKQVDCVITYVDTLVYMDNDIYFLLPAHNADIEVGSIFIFICRFPPYHWRTVRKRRVCVHCSSCIWHHCAALPQQVLHNARPLNCIKTAFDVQSMMHMFCRQSYSRTQRLWHNNLCQSWRFVGRFFCTDQDDVKTCGYQRNRKHRCRRPKSHIQDESKHFTLPQNQNGRALHVSVTCVIFVVDWL